MLIVLGKISKFIINESVSVEWGIQETKRKIQEGGEDEAPTQQKGAQRKLLQVAPIINFETSFSGVRLQRIQRGSDFSKSSFESERNYLGTEELNFLKIEEPYKEGIYELFNEVITAATLEAPHNELNLNINGPSFEIVSSKITLTSSMPLSLILTVWISWNNLRKLGFLHLKLSPNVLNGIQWFSEVDMLWSDQVCSLVLR